MRKFTYGDLEAPKGKPKKGQPVLSRADRVFKRILEMINSHAEFEKWRVRQSDKKELSEFNKDLKFPLDKGAINTGARKAWILLQMGIERKDPRNWELKKFVSDA